MSYSYIRLSPRRGFSVVVALAVAGALAVSVGLFATSAQAATLPTVSIAISKSSATISGALESGGVNVVTTASGVKEANAIVFLLKPGVSVAEAEAFIKEKKVHHDPNNTAKLGSIVFDAEAGAGHKNETQTVFQPGQYLLLVGEGEGEAKLRTTFTVATAKAPATLPTPEATIRSIEFGFRGPSTLHDGELVRFENEGFLVHMDIVFPVKNHADAKKAVKDLLAGNEKGLEKLIAGEPFGAGPLSHEAFQQQTITAKPGWYVQACFMETQDGRDHTRLGMERIIRIVK
ncbi:MAG: hypothetical protein ACLQMH_07260 [Solirubrobacteraceae bacterium]